MDQSTGVALQAFLNRLISRSHLTDEERRAVLALPGEVKSVRAHIDFVKLNERVEHSCLVMDGLVGRFGQKKDGVRQIACLYIPGDMADLPAVVSPRSAWGLAALTATTVLKVPHTAIRSMAAKHPGISEALWRDCVADGSIFSEWVVNVGRRSSIARIAHLICEMAIRCEIAGQGDRHSFPLPISQADVGDATALTPVHVNRTLKELRTQDVVTFRSGKITVHDWQRLVSIGEFDSAFMLLGGPSPRVAVSPFASR